MKETDNGKTHWFGCHKVHIECANKKIEELKKIISEEGLDCDTGHAECDGDGADPICANHGRIGQWLESLGEK